MNPDRKIVPLESRHLALIDLPEDNEWYLHGLHHAATILGDTAILRAAVKHEKGKEKVLALAILYIIWGKMGHLSLAFDMNLNHSPLNPDMRWLHKHLYLEFLKGVGMLSLERIGTYVKVGELAPPRWAEWFGFRKECFLRKFGYEGEDFWQYAWLKDEQYKGKGRK